MHMKCKYLARHVVAVSFHLSFFAEFQSLCDQQIKILHLQHSKGSVPAIRNMTAIHSQVAEQCLPRSLQHLEAPWTSPSDPPLLYAIPRYVHSIWVSTTFPRHCLPTPAAHLHNQPLFPSGYGSFSQNLFLSTSPDIVFSSPPRLANRPSHLGQQLLLLLGTQIG